MAARTTGPSPVREGAGRPTAHAWARALAVVALAGWFGGSVATGQRGVGASLAWLVPAVVATGAAAFPLYLGGKGGGRSARRASVPPELAAAAVAVAGLVAALWSSDGLNHAWATTPRARLATLAPLALVVVLSTGWRLGAMSVGRARRAGLMASIGASAMAFFVATASGRLVTPDEWTIHAAAVGLVEHGRLAVFDGEPYRFGLTGRVRASEMPSGDGTASASSKYPAVGSLVVAPFHAAARLLGAPDPATAAQWPPPERASSAVTMLAGPATGAALVAAAAWLAREAGLRGMAMVVVALATATASLAWPYSSTLLNMNATGAALAGATAAALRAAVTPTAGWFVAGGVLLGLAAASRYEFLLLGAPVAVLVARAAWRARVPGLHMRVVRPCAAAALGWGSVVGPLVFGWNLARTGSPLDFGYGDEGLLASLLEKPWYGWFGLLASPGCGVLVYAPLMLVGLFAMAWLWEDAPPAALAGSATVVIALAYYGSVSSTWCAQTTWGPRYLAAVAPLALLPVGSLWARLAAPGSPWRRNPFAWLALGVPWAANVGVNLLAVLVDFGRGWQDHWALGATYQTAAWVPYFSGVTAHVRLLRTWVAGGEASIDVHWLRGAGGTPTVAGAVAMAALLVVAAALAGRAWGLAAAGMEGATTDGSAGDGPSTPAAPTRALPR